MRRRTERRLKKAIVYTGCLALVALSYWKALEQYRECRAGGESRCYCTLEHLVR